jgi:hypothetical protein
MNMAHNGWKNKETWLVNVWFGDYLTELESEGVFISTDTIRDLVDEMVESVELNGFLSDILNCSLGEIDYREIADAYNVTEEEDEE